MGRSLSAEAQLADLDITSAPDHPLEILSMDRLGKGTGSGMSKFNPDFWEVTLSEAGWQRFTTQDHPYFEKDEDLDVRHEWDERARDMRGELEAVIAEVLTDRQRSVVELHFFGQMNQRQIGEKLGISQQAVGQHLYGKLRNGKSVGGALRKLRKVCAQRGISWR